MQSIFYRIKDQGADKPYIRLSRASRGPDVAAVIGLDAKGIESTIGFEFRAATPEQADRWLKERGIAAAIAPSPVKTSALYVLTAGESEETALTDEQIDGWWQVTRTGSWTGSLGGEPFTFVVTPEKLAEIAAGYSENVLEAPVNIDHFGWGPAYAWVAAVRMAGEALEVRLKQINPELRAGLKTGAYRSRSAEIIPDFMGTGKPYLSGLAFLGAANPAVKGLAPVPSTYSEEGADVLTFQSDGREHADPSVINQIIEGTPMDATEKKGLIEEMKAAFSGLFAPKENSENVVKLTAAVEALTASVTALKTENAELKGRLDGTSKAATMAAFTSAVDAAVTAHKATPMEAKALKLSAEHMDDAARKAVTDELAARQPVAAFAQLSAPDKDNKEGDGSLALFGGDKLTARANELRKANPELSLRDAMQAAVNENPTLDFKSASGGN